MPGRTKYAREAMRSAERRHDSPCTGLGRGNTNTGHSMNTASAKTHDDGRMRTFLARRLRHALQLEGTLDQNHLLRHRLQPAADPAPSSNPTCRSASLRKAPPLQGTPWDALLAATAEHFATRHGLAHQPWMNEPERFLDTPWMPLEQGHYRRWETALYCRGAFARHGTPVHPSDLDSRGGDEPWKPDCCDATTFAEPSELLRP